MQPKVSLATLVVAVFVSTLPLAAQRKQASFEWQKRATVLDYGVVPVGKHSLDALAVGSSWRLGANQASTWKLAMPILAGDAVLPPGQFRVQLRREQEERLTVTLAGASAALGSGSADLTVQGSLSKLDKPVSKLAISLLMPPKTKAVDGNQALAMHVDFGEHRWSGDITVLGGKASTKVAGYTLVVFGVPEAVFAARGDRGLAIATLQKKTAADGMPEGWNLVLLGDEAKLVPWMQAPTEQNGFGAVTPPEAAWTTTGTVTASDAQGDDAPSVLELQDAGLQKGELNLTLWCGKQLLAVALPEPKPAKKDSR